MWSLNLNGQFPCNRKVSSGAAIAEWWCLCRIASLKGHHHCLARSNNRGLLTRVLPRLHDSNQARLPAGNTEARSLTTIAFHSVIRDRFKKSLPFSLHIPFYSISRLVSFLSEFAIQQINLLFQLNSE
jgi:hypothetical protein